MRALQLHTHPAVPLQRHHNKPDPNQILTTTPHSATNCALTVRATTRADAQARTRRHTARCVYPHAPPPYAAHLAAHSTHLTLHHRSHTCTTPHDHYHPRHHHGCVVSSVQRLPPPSLFESAAVRTACHGRATTLEQPAPWQPSSASKTTAPGCTECAGKAAVGCSGRFELVLKPQLADPLLSTHTGRRQVQHCG
jgi:hypothetical protein